MEGGSYLAWGGGEEYLQEAHHEDGVDSNLLCSGQSQDTDGRERQEKQGYVGRDVYCRVREPLRLIVEAGCVCFLLNIPVGGYRSAVEYVGEDHPEPVDHHGAHDGVDGSPAESLEYPQVQDEDGQLGQCQAEVVDDNGKVCGLQGQISAEGLCGRPGGYDKNIP